MPSRTHEQNRPELTSLLIEHWHRILAFADTLVPNRTDADDVLQDASLVMWEKFHEFEAGTDFVKWAHRIVYLCVKNFRRKRARGQLLFDDSLVDRLGETADALVDEAEERHAALRDCLGELPDRERRMLGARFATGGSVEKAAAAAERTLAATYKALARARNLLADCVTRKLAGEGGL